MSGHGFGHGGVRDFFSVEDTPEHACLEQARRILRVWRIAHPTKCCEHRDVRRYGRPCDASVSSFEPACPCQRIWFELRFTPFVQDEVLLHVKRFCNARASSKQRLC